MNKHLLLLSGGVGSRFGAKMPKQYYESKDGELIITKSIKPFLGKDFTSLTIVCDPMYIDLIKEELGDKIDPTMKLMFTNNGSERQESIDNGVKKIQEEFEIGDLDHLFLQEAVRPFVSEEIIDALINAEKQWMSVSPAIHPAVLYGTMNGLQVEELIPKKDIIELQVPKRHNLKYMIDHREVIGNNYETILDESQIFTATGRRIHLVEGSVKNVKITFPSHKKLLEI